MWKWLSSFQDTTPQKNSHQGEMKQASNLQVLGPAGEIIAGITLLQFGFWMKDPTTIIVYLPSSNLLGKDHN